MMQDKKILAIETSGELCSVSLSYEYDKYDERNILMKHIHSEKLIPMIDDVLSSNKITTDQLDIISVSAGPGSFTGLRIGMTAAKGIAFASNLPIVPVPSFAALSLEISESLPIDLTFCIVNNANIDECYFAKFKNEVSGPISIEDVKLLQKSDLDKEIINSDLIFGNLTSLKETKKISSARASYIAKWTYLFGQDLLTFDYDYLEPNYLKNFKVGKNK